MDFFHVLLIGLLAIVFWHYHRVSQDNRKLALAAMAYNELFSDCLEGMPIDHPTVAMSLDRIREALAR